MSPSFASGVAGGVLATVVATTVYALAGRDRPLPATRLWAEFVLGGDRPNEGVWPGITLHGLAGALAGGCFGLAVALLAPGGTLTLVWAVLWGVCYGVALWGIHVGGVLHLVLGVPIDRERLAGTFVHHVVYGTVLGGWTGLGLFAAIG